MLIGARGPCSVLDSEENSPSKKGKEKGTAKPERITHF